MINTVKCCIEVQMYQHCGPTTVCTYVYFTEGFEGSLCAVVSMETRLKKY